MKISKLLLAAFIGFLAIGILSACNLQKKTEQKREVTLTTEEKKVLRKEEEKIALFLLNHYEDVKKIEFVNFYKGGFGTESSISVRVNSTTYIKPITFGAQNGEYVIGYDPDKFHLLEKEIPTKVENLENVEVKYYRGE
ncbi:ubiquitin carboxyl-hydrolase [Streptococcus panodentis]|uniref:Ubiquitin carboxyl-hydrolase n=1 Tax=Streptococcus panodentis TaxID=1581472 RepID=A0ABS5AXE1_9STRE|nr:ubiquitin carboxyl-hydrolase [Streptococcus panodentis]MBP2621111.1 ubiquitin carboxyl-hydrolase [Streptococcus panodentis]